MKDEIKDLIKLLNEYKIREKNGEDKFYPEDIIIIDELWQLLDYITNLQEENERLIRIKKFYKNSALNNFKEKADYKTRIDKAIEYLKTTERITNNPLNTEDNFDRLWINGHEDKIENIDNLINILKGEEKW